MVIDEPKGFYFYVLYCQDHSLYGGYTTLLSQRLAKHNAGKGAKYTSVKKRRPLKLIYVERWSSKSLAMSAEYHFKQLSRPQKEIFLYKNGVKELKGSGYVINDFSHQACCIIKDRSQI